jgi:protein CpxP
MKMFRIIFAAFALATLVGSLTLMFGQSRNNGGRTQSDGQAEIGGRQRPDGPPMPPPHDGLDPHMLRELNLSDAQQEQIKALHESARTASQQYFEQLRPIDEQLRTVAQAAAFNEEQARTLLANKAQVMTELELIRLRADSATYNILNAEQKARLEQLKQERPEFPRGGERPEGAR